MSADLANARMVDRHRQAVQVGLENSVRRSRPAPRRISSSGQSISAMAGALVARLRSAAARPRVSPAIN